MSHFTNQDKCLVWGILHFLNSGVISSERVNISIILVRSFSELSGPEFPHAASARRRPIPSGGAGYVQIQSLVRMIQFDKDVVSHNIAIKQDLGPTARTVWGIARCHSTKPSCTMVVS